MKLRALLWTVLGLLLGAAGIWIVANREGLQHFPPIISSYYAKELCSCLFVVGQPEDFCHGVVRQYVPISSFQIDSAAHRVTVTGLFMTNSARLVSERYGCVLEGAD